MLIAVLLLAACDVGTTATTSQSALPTVAIVRRLATVYLSPTPGDAERRGTEAAAQPTAPPAPAATATATVYVGVFVGVSEDDAGIPNVDVAQYQGTRAAEQPAVAVPTLSTEAGACTISADPIFGTAWSLNPQVAEALGCAGEPVTPYVGSGQVFEHGVMYFIPTGEIWAIAPNASGGQYWHVFQAPPEQTWSVPAPEGLRVPTLGFGAVWRAVSGVRETLGFASVDENAASLALQRFTGGALLRDDTAGQVFALIGGEQGSAADNGVVYGPY